MFQRYITVGILSIALIVPVEAHAHRHRHHQKPAATVTPMPHLTYDFAIGQSLALGWRSHPATDPTNVNPNALMFNTGTRPNGCNLDPSVAMNPASLGALVPLTEADQSGLQGGCGQTMGTGLTALMRTPILWASMGVGGTSYIDMAKGTVAFENSLETVQRAVDLNRGNVSVDYIPVVHGENDFKAGTSRDQYRQDLESWLNDYCAAIMAITHQQKCPVLGIDQMNSYTSSLYSHYASATSVIPLAQLDATQGNYRNYLIPVTPKYFFTYEPDGVHLTPKSEELLGEYHAKAATNPTFRGLTPRGHMFWGRSLSISFNVPVPPLRLDEETVTDPGNYGFIYDDDCHSAHITEIHVIGTVVGMHLNQAPTCGHPHVSYAFVGIVGQNAGPTTGARGNLHDSDSTPSQLDGRPLRNYAWAFDLPL